MLVSTTIASVSDAFAARGTHTYYTSTAKAAVRVMRRMRPSSASVTLPSMRYSSESGLRAGAAVVSWTHSGVGHRYLWGRLACAQTKQTLTSDLALCRAVRCTEGARLCAPKIS